MRPPSPVHIHSYFNGPLPPLSANVIIECPPKWCNDVCYGESKKEVLSHTIENQQESVKEKWESSGTTEHCLKCHRWLKCFQWGQNSMFWNKKQD